MHIISALFNPSFSCTFELKVLYWDFVRIFLILICKSLREKNLSVRYYLRIFKCGVSLEGLFKSGVSLEDCKGYLEPKVQDGGLES